MNKIKVTIWNEFRHECKDTEAGAYMRSFYPKGIHAAIAEHIASDELDIRCATLDEPEQGLPESLLQDTEVLLWWGHAAHKEVNDELVDRIQKRVQAGMGLIILHSGHFSKIFKRMMGSSCSLRWRDVGEKERLWCLDPSHPIAKGVPETFTLPHTEMYGEPFAIPDDGKVVYMSWYEGGNVFRSGVCFQRDLGKIFYFSPGHETYPIYHDENVCKVIANAVRWAAPEKIFPERETHEKEPSEMVVSVKPEAKL